MAWQTFLAVLGLSTGQPVLVAEASPGGPIFSITDYPDGAEQEAGRWIMLFGLGQHLLLPDGPDRETFWRLLAVAAERGVSLRIRFDGSAGRLAADGRHLEYPLCSIGTATGASFGDERRNCPLQARRPRDAARDLALGVAQASEYPEAAQRSLAAALAAGRDLPAPARIIAHQFRGEAASSLADDLEPSDPAYDRFLAEALADYRSRAALAPDDAQAFYSVARVLMALGGYDDARRVYENIRRRWPAESFEVAIRIGALYRQRGEYARALRELDDYARRDLTPTDGMKFHYHRAWTLTLLDRFAEAEREIDRGLMTQPDYTSAYHLRSCARARLGRLEDALADQRRALELLAGIMSEPRPAVRADMARSRSVIAALEGAITRGHGGPLTTACEGFWDRLIRPRAPSPSLAAGGASPG